MVYFDSPSMLVVFITSLSYRHEGSLDGVLEVTGFFESVLNRNGSYL